jgi:hypothetical protein
VYTAVSRPCLVLEATRRRLESPFGRLRLFPHSAAAGSSPDRFPGDSPDRSRDLFYRQELAAFRRQELGLLPSLGQPRPAQPRLCPWRIPPRPVGSRRNSAPFPTTADQELVGAGRNPAPAVLLCRLLRLVGLIQPPFTAAELSYELSSLSIDPDRIV